jgi:hypothetical protein
MTFTNRDGTDCGGTKEFDIAGMAINVMQLIVFIMSIRLDADICGVEIGIIFVI